MNHTTVIGLEVHVQLLTRTKLFCGCPNRFNPEQPNAQTCPVCLGLPGALPVMNRQAFLLALKTGLALGCDISPYTKWDRKQYYYPDLPKGYQISQFDLPFSTDGRIELEVNAETGERRTVRILRAHLEEDAGKNLHDESGRGRDSLVDLNRCGTPLLEIVTQPDLRSAAEARHFLEELRLLLTYLGVSDCNMQEGSLRCDANVNLHIHTADGHKLATPITEIKNVNSFRFVEQAIEYEARRQHEEWQQTGRKLGDPGVTKETRGYDPERGVTFAQRGKEEASDYRYFPDPDLVPVTVGDELIEEIRGTLGEAPAARRERYKLAYELSNYDAGVIIDHGRPLADYYEEVATGCGDGKLAANWVTQDVLRELKERKLTIEQFPLRASVLAALLRKVKAGEITTKSAREVFAQLLADSDAARSSVTGPTEIRPHSTTHAHTSSSPAVSVERIEEIVRERALSVVSDTVALGSIIDAVIAHNPKAVEDFRGGKQAAVGKLIGEVMREVKGADAKQVRELLVQRLSVK